MSNYKLKHLIAMSAVIETLKTGIADNDFSVSMSEDTKMMFYTSSACISGDFYLPDQDSGITQFSEKELLDVIIKTSSEVLKDNGTSESSPIYLKNVTITPFSNPNVKMKLEFFCLYSEQVVGLSFGQEHEFQ